MKPGQSITRLGVTVRHLGSLETRNGVAWSAEVVVGGRKFHVENDGNGGCDVWRADGSARLNEGCAEAWATIAALARREPALAEYAKEEWFKSGDAEAAGLWVCAALDGAFRVATVR